MATRVSRWKKFKLLLWKNWLLQWKHKTQLIVEILIPTMFFLFLVLLRLAANVEKIETTVFPEINIGDLSLFRDNFNFKDFELPRFEIPYSPANPYLDDIIQRAVKKLQLVGYKGYADAQSLQNELTSSKYFAGVQFDDSLASIKSYPEKLSFSLRFPSESRTKLLGWSWETQHLYPEIILPGPRNPENADDGIPVGYVREGFIALQQAISMSYLEIVGNVSPLPEISMRRYPYPPYIKDPLLEVLRILMAFIIFISFIYPCTCITQYIAYEKEKQLKEVMKIMGIPNWIHWTAWFVKSILILSLSCLIIIILVKIKLPNKLAVLPYSSWTALIPFFLVYSISIICFCFMMAVFFSKASTAATATGLVFFMTYVPFMILNGGQVDLSLGQELGWSLILNSGMGLGLNVILGFEGTGEGLQWDNIFTPVNVDDSITLGAVMIMMLIGSAICMIICLYIEQIFPGEFGVPKKWNFIFTSKFWCTEYDYNGEEDLSTNVKSQRNPEAFEREPKDKQIGLEVKNLKKMFDKRWVVHGLTINMYENEITVLLGHNGAGKTTTISMLTGMIPPTAGTAIINGHDISNNIEEARTSMGICPQHNVLFDDMSVANHIVFFSRLKGLNRQEIQREVDKYLKIIGLEKKADTLSANLSGGMKRKLSVCCALCGGTKVVLLDEPSSGMDPAARRQLWDLLRVEKSGRTVLLTTQYMDEADVLGDRIAIMCEGELKCHGTSFFLKKKFGDGYRLICVKRENCNVSDVTNLLNKYIPGIQPESDIGTELTYQLPDNMSRYFEEMLADLENKSNSLGLNGYGIGVTSMEEVFMKVGAESSSNKEKATNETGMNGNDDDLESTYVDGVIAGKSKGTTLFCNQWEAMLTKKILYTWRNKFLFLIQNILPICFVAVTILIKHQENALLLPSITISLTQYRKVFAVVEVSPDVQADSLEWKIHKEYADILNSYGENYEFKSTGGITFSDYILNLAKTIQTQVNSQYLVAATISEGKLIAWLNNKPLHTPPLTLNLLHNAMAKALIGPGAEIIVSNHPLPFSTESKLNKLDITTDNMALHTSLCMAFVTALYILFIIKENASRSKLLQFVGGVRVWNFWLTHFLWDMLTFTFTAIVLIVTLASFQEEGYSTFDELIRYFSILITFGFAALPMTYLLAFLFSDPATGFSRVSMLNIFTGMALFIAIFFMKVLEFKKQSDDLKDIFQIFPHFCLATGMENLNINSATYRACLNIRHIPKELLCQSLPLCCNLKPYYDWETPGVLPEIVYMLTVGTACFILIFAYELQLFSQLSACLTSNKRRQPSNSPENDNSDSDVLDEKNRILAMTKDEIASEYLVLDRVTKYYKKFLAVNQISLCVKQGECFGLLGVNGAGKTTTFKMMTGEERITYGKAYVKGMSLSSGRNSIYKKIGYCPQFDALFDDMTGRENLRIFCLLRGVPRRRIRQVSEELAQSFGFTKHINKRTKTYSGGNKRKLSTAIAVIGGPWIMYLDEPTSGMDPAARRQLWNMVCRIRDSGNSVVLTSHSMEECEALCTRLAIMVNGEFKCLGSTQHLKNKFSKGLVLKIKIRPTRDSSASLDESRTTEESDDISVVSQRQTDIRRVKEAIEKKYSDAVLQEEYHGMLTFYVPLVGIKWSEIFGFVERNRVNWNIEDYSISQTTLEEIFLEFAKIQSSDSRASNPKKRCCASGSSCCRCRRS